MSSIIGLPLVPRRDGLQYKQNVLRNVLCVIEFNSFEVNSAVINDFRERAYEHFPESSKPQNTEVNVEFSKGVPKATTKVWEVNGIICSSKDSQSVIQIEDSRISLTIPGKEYANFESFQRILVNVAEMLFKSHQAIITKISLKKTNVIYASPSYENETTQSLLEGVINPDFLPNNIGNSTTKATSFTTQTTYETENQKLILNLSLLPQTVIIDSKKTFQFVIDVDWQEIFRKLTAAQCEHELKRINAEAYSIFMNVAGGKLKDFLQPSNSIGL